MKSEDGRLAFGLIHELPYDIYGFIQRNAFSRYESTIDVGFLLAKQR